MDGLHRNIVEGVVNVASYYSPQGIESLARLPSPSFTQRRMEDLETLVVTKRVAGFDRGCVDGLRDIIAQAAAGTLGPLKFITFEFAHDGTGSSAGADGFQTLVSEVANLILRAPVVSVACARGYMEGADLEFALACSMLIGEDGATFSFSGDPVISVGVYGFLAQKIGFVAAERLMEEGEVLQAEQMRQLLLLKDVAERGDGAGGMEQFLRRTARRHNSCYGIYRAQRIASPAVDESRRAAS